MARREIITIDGRQHYGLNVEATVGSGGSNQVGDVIVVQAMFRYLAELTKDPFFAVGVESMSEVPEPTGKFDKITRRAIRAFQKNNDYLLLSVDGMIHPASYQNRNVRFVTSNDNEDLRFMCITLLHTELFGASENDVDYTLAIIRRFPILGSWIKWV